MKKLKKGDALIAPQKIKLKNFTPGEEYPIHSIEYFEKEYSFEIVDNNGNVGWFYNSEYVSEDKRWIAKKEPVEVVMFKWFRYICFSVVLFFLAILSYRILMDLIK